MESYSSQCFVCSNQFSTPVELRDHVWHFQTEITALLAKLHQLLAHRDPAPPVPEVTSISKRVESKRRGNPEARTRSLVVIPAPLAQDGLGLTTGPTEAAADPQSRPKSTIKCPHDDCQGHSNTFTRQQDLARHYARHVRCNEFCPFCSTTYTQAHKYIGHKCANDGPVNQTSYTKTRVDALRDQARRELTKKRKFDKLHPHSDQTKRSKTLQPRSTDDASVMLSPKLPPVDALHETRRSHATSGALAYNGPAPSDYVASNELNAHQVANWPATQPSDIVDRESAASSTFRPFNFPPLFSSLDSDWQSQLQFPDPLWSLQPTHNEGSLPGYEGGLDRTWSVVLD